MPATLPTASSRWQRLSAASPHGLLAANRPALKIVPAPIASTLAE